MNQEIKNYYNNLWIKSNDSYTRHVLYIDDLDFYLNNYLILKNKIVEIVKAEKKPMRIACVFSDEKSVLIYHDIDDDNEMPGNITYKFNATAIVFCVDNTDQLINIRHSYFDNFKSLNYYNLDNDHCFDFSNNGKSLVSTTKEDLYHKIKLLKYKKIENLYESLYNLELIDCNLTNY